jgi:hypothetical protein
VVALVVCDTLLVHLFLCRAIQLLLARVAVLMAVILPLLARHQPVAVAAAVVLLAVLVEMAALVVVEVHFVELV